MIRFARLLVLLPLLWVEVASSTPCDVTILSYEYYPAPDYFFDEMSALEALGDTDCTVVNGFLAVRGEGIPHLDPLINLTRIDGELNLVALPDLISIDGLSNISSVGQYLSVAYAANLANLDGLSGVVTVGTNLAIAGLSLTDIDGLANLRHLGGLLIVGNHNLINVDALAGLTKLEIAVPILGAPGDGDDLQIVSNHGLTNLNGLTNIASVEGDLRVVDNPNLTNCTGIAKLLGWPNGLPDESVGGEIVIRNNGVGCNSVEEVLASVPLKAPSAPTITATDLEDGKIILNVSVSNNGGADITYYDATCTDGANIFTGTSGSSPITVSGLTNDVAYTCTVTATNSVGTSSASAATAPITPQATSTGLPIWLLYQATQ